MDIQSIQRALLARGYDLGKAGADGIWGRASIAAAKAFQKASKLEVDGVVGEKTLAALGLSTAAAPASPPPVWIELARTKMGLSETRNNAELKAFLKSDGNTLGDPAKLPWCGDFVETCVALTLPDEHMVANPYYALNWLKFGRELKEPAVGAVLVFKRTGGGHVGFYVGERKDAYRVLGGNQGNSVSETWVLKSRCAGIRWPETAPLPTAGRVASAAAGAVSTNEA
ncbi:TIGR02594 family protein [Methylobacterium sp. SD21]|uniref:NlpC/P60 family protein n=1 Tax=Methylobacterium litchii TaxID=3138810 RepID=UPI00313B7FCD